MCTSPVLIKLNAKGINERSERYIRKYRLGLPTNERVKKVLPCVNEDLPRKAYLDSAELRYRQLLCDISGLPFITREKEAQAMEARHVYEWLKSQDVATLKTYLYRPMLVKCKGHAVPCMLVPCGHCAECIQSRVTDLRFSIVRDVACTSMCDAYMLTLTYDSLHLPTDTDVCRLGDEALDGLAHCDSGFLCRQDLTNYLKRLRITLSRWYDITNVKFFYCGEYGKNTCRPHYHILVWFTLTTKALFGYKYTGKFTGKQSIFSSLVKMNNGHVPALSKAFRFISFESWGNCRRQAFVCDRARNLTASANYIAKYLGKSLSYKSGGLPEELADSFAVHAVPMFVRASCKLAYNWAATSYDTKPCLDGCEKMSFKSKEGHTVEYMQRIPRRLLEYIDALRLENNLEDVRQMRKNKRQDDKVLEISLSDFYRNSHWSQFPVEDLLCDPIFVRDYDEWTKRLRCKSQMSFADMDANDRLNNL